MLSVRAVLGFFFLTSHRSGLDWNLAPSRFSSTVNEWMRERPPATACVQWTPLLSLIEKVSDISLTKWSSQTPSDNCNFFYKVKKQKTKKKNSFPAVILLQQSRYIRTECFHVAFSLPFQLPLYWPVMFNSQYFTPEWKTKVSYILLVFGLHNQVLTECFRRYTVRIVNKEESWAPKNRCFWTVVLETTLESRLDCKEIQPVHSEGDRPWDFFGRNGAKAETPVLWLPHAKSWLIGKDSDAGRDWGQEEKGTTEDEMARWHHRLNGHEFG